MRELNYESVKDVACISVRKKDWTLKLLSEPLDNSGNPVREMEFNVSPISREDDRLSVGSRDGVVAILILLAKILQSMFVLVEENESYIIYYRIDSKMYKDLQYIKECKEAGL